MVDLAVPPLQLANAFVDLVADRLAGQPAAGAEAAIVAKRAAAGRHGAVDVGASELGVDADLLDPVAEFVTQKMVVAVVAQPGGEPVEVRFGRGGCAHGDFACEK